MIHNGNIRIALICNMNNMFSSVCKYLIDSGYDAHLFQYNTHPSHFDGRADSFGNILDNRIHIINWTSPGQLLTYSTDKIKTLLHDFDFIIACGTTPAFLSKAGIKLDLFIPYGSDIYTYPFFEFTYNPIYMFKKLYFQYHQRNGIRNAVSFMMEKQIDWVEKKAKSLRIKGDRFNTSIPMVHLPTYENITPNELNNLSFYNKYLDIRAAQDLVIFHHSRHSWKNPQDKFELKGNNILFKGFADFLKQNANIKACIVTLEYGNEVDESKALIKELGIEENVYWMPKQDRKELMMGISLCDFVVGELYNSFNLYGVTTEALQMGKPIMQKRIDEEFTNDYNTLHPIIYADSAEQVSAGITSYIKNPGYYHQQGIEGRKWYTKNILNKFLSIIDKLIKDKHAVESKE
ncbi:glycosyltransferase [Pedobacter sp.]|uniref:glycosyltransferase n=1 Tax=Pedobacter sp. TaxID=1411316 RepID=UPI003BAA9D81